MFAQGRAGCLSVMERGGGEWAAAPDREDHGDETGTSQARRWASLQTQGGRRALPRQGSEKACKWGVEETNTHHIHIIQFSHFPPQVSRAPDRLKLCMTGGCCWVRLNLTGGSLAGVDGVYLQGGVKRA